MDPIICWAEEFIITVCGPASSLWICVAMMALLTDQGYHHLIITISALLAQALWSCDLAGEDTVLPALLSPWLPVHLLCGAARSCCSLTEPDHAEDKSLKNKFLLFWLWRKLQPNLPRDILDWASSEQSTGDMRNIRFIQTQTAGKHASYGIWWD